jgi:hypothetical protein
MNEVAQRLGSDPLEADGYEALRARLEKNDIVVATALRDYMDFLASCYSNHKAQLDAYLYEGGKLSTDECDEEIARCEGEIARRSNLISYPDPSWSEYSFMYWENEIGCYRAMIRELRDVRQRIIDYDNATAGIYSHLGALIKEMNKGVSHVAGIARDGICFIEPEPKWNRTDFDKLLRDGTIARFRDSDGNYNWVAINAAFSRQADEISDLEYYVLAEMYAAMDIGDTERFLQRLAERGDDYPAPIIGSSNAAPYTNWTFDPVKIEKLSSAYLVMCYNDITNMSESETTNALMKFSVLSALPSLGMRFGSGIHSTTDAEFPPIELSGGDCEGSYRLTYSGQYYTSNANSGIIGGGVVDSTSYTLHQYTMDFNIGRSDDILANLAVELNGNVSSALGFGSTDVASIALTVVGLAPGAGLPAGAFSLFNTGGDIYRRSELVGDINTVTESINNMSQAYNQLGCWASTNSGTEYGWPPGVAVFKGASTEGIIAGVNKVISDNPGITNNLGVPVTFDAITSNPEAYIELIHDPEFRVYYDPLFNSPPNV